MKPTNHALWPLFAADFLVAMASGTVFPLLAGLQDAHHLPTYGLGLIAGGSFVGGLAAQVLLAGQADRGRSRPLLVGGLVTACLALVWFALADQLWQFVLARSMTGIALGCFQPAARAIAASVNPDAMGHSLGRLAGIELSGFILGPAVASALADAFNLDVPFLAMAVAIAVGGGVVLHKGLPDRAATSTNSRVSPALLRDRRIASASVLALGLFLPVGVYESLWSRYLEDRGASTLFIGVSLTLYGLPFILFSSRGGRIADRVGAQRACLMGIAFVVPVTIGYGLLHSPVAIVAIGLVEGVAAAVAAPASQAYMVQVCPPDRIAAGQGLAGAMSQLAAGLTALGAAPLYDIAGPATVFTCAGVMIAVCAGVSYALGRTRRTPLPVPATTGG